MKPHDPVGHSGEWSVELLRGMAALLVVLAHYGPMNGLDLGLLAFAHSGVDLFFVLSGFVFAPYLLGKRLDVRGHFVRRFFRLYPLYAAALVVYAWPKLGDPGLPVIFLKHVFFVHTLESLEVAFYLNPAFWSLPPEVEFYLALPLLCLLMRTPLGVVAAGILATLLHLALNFFPQAAGSAFNPAILQVHLPGLLCEFLFGVIAWHVARNLECRLVRVLLVIAGVGSWLALASVFVAIGDAGIESNVLLRGNMGLLSAMAFALVVCGVCGAISRPSGALRWGARWCGNLSYGIYLFHNAAPAMLRGLGFGSPGVLFALASLALTLLIAWLLFLLWENPWRNFGRRLARRGAG